MLLKQEYSNGYLNDKFDQYIDTYNDAFLKEETDKLRLCLNNGLFTSNLPCEITQFYHEYDLINKKLDIYYGFKELLENIYSDLNKRNIVEIGAGRVPQLSRELAKTSDKQIVALDRIISKKNNNYDNLNVVKGEFFGETTLSDKQLLVGLYPCESTLDIVKVACKHDTDFLILICDCIYGQSKSLILSDYLQNKFLEEVNSYTIKSNLGELKTASFDNSKLIYTNKLKK